MKYAAVFVIVSLLIGLGAYKKHTVHQRTFGDYAITPPGQAIEPPPPGVNLDPYCDEHVVPEHESTCDYCGESFSIAERNFGSYHRINDRLTGEHAHFHHCPSCRGEFVCPCECTIDERQIQHHQEGTRPRYGGAEPNET